MNAGWSDCGVLCCQMLWLIKSKLRSLLALIIYHQQQGFPTRLLGWEGSEVFNLIRNLFSAVSFNLSTLSPVYPDTSVEACLSKQESDFQAASIKQPSLIPCWPLRHLNLKRNPVWLFHCRFSFRFEKVYFHRGSQVNAATSAELCKEEYIKETFFVSWQNLFCFMFSTGLFCPIRPSYSHIIPSTLFDFANKRNMVCNVIVQSSCWAAFIFYLLGSLWKIIFGAVSSTKCRRTAGLRVNTPVENPPKI